MRYLQTDKQTCSDLEISDTQYDTESLVSLFQKTETKQGRVIISDWLLHPLSDREAIRERQEAIAYDSLPTLPLDEDELDFIEYYLDYRDQIRKPYFLLSYLSAFDRLWRYDAKRYIVCRGVKMVVNMLHRMEKLKSDFGNAELPRFWQKAMEQIELILSASRLTSVLRQTSSSASSKKRLSIHIIDK